MHNFSRCRFLTRLLESILIQLSFVGATAAFGITLTTTTMTVSADSQASGTVLTLTATVIAGATNVNSGTVTFCDSSFAVCRDLGTLGSRQLTSAGTATFNFIPGIGAHTYKAGFMGTSTYGASTSSINSVTVTGNVPTTTTISSTGSAGNYGLSGQVVSGGSLAIPSGLVSFQDASNAAFDLGSATLDESTYSPMFVPAASQSGTGGMPKGSTVADFNGDGIPDLAITSYSDGNLSILLGNGDGTFTAAGGSPILVGNNNIGVVTGDFNGDGKADIAVTSYSWNVVNILLGNGDGTFKTPVSITVSPQPEAIQTADLNHDGNLDLVIAHENGNTVSVLWGDGTGAFPTTSSVATGPQPYSIAIADFNGDGNLDIVTGNKTSNTVTVLMGDGMGNFTEAAGSPVSAGWNPTGIVAGDFNGDGTIDLAVGDAGDPTNPNDSSTYQISILLGNGDGTFKARVPYPAGYGGKSIVAADFNHDGKIDLAFCSIYSGTFTIYIGKGDGTFQTRTRYTAPTQRSPCSSITTADFDGDGLPDLQGSIQNLLAGTVQYSETLLIKMQHTASLPNIAIPGSGSHNISAAFAGDTINLASTSPTISLTASPITTVLTLQSEPSASRYGQQVVLRATLSPYVVGNLSTEGEIVTFRDANTTVGTGTLSSGAATFTTTSLPIGTDSLTTFFGADANFVASTSGTVAYVVGNATPIITWAAPASIPYGTPLSATQLNATSGGVAGTFFYMPGPGSVMSAGAAQNLRVNFTPSDPATYTSASTINSITVTQAMGSVLLSTSSTSQSYGSAITFTATAPTAGTGIVTFRDGATVLGTASLSGGSTTFMTKCLSGGSHNITASWPGDANYLGSASSVLVQTVVRAAVSIVSYASLNPSLYGDSVDWTIHLSGTGAIPTGTMTLTDGTAPFATLELNGSGDLTYTFPSLTTGSHTLEVVYNGDANYL